MPGKDEMKKPEDARNIFEFRICGLRATCISVFNLPIENLWRNRNLVVAKSFVPSVLSREWCQNL